MSYFGGDLKYWYNCTSIVKLVVYEFMFQSYFPLVLLCRYMTNSSFTISAFFRKRAFYLSPMLSGVNEDFQAAKARLNTLKNEPDNVVKLKIYALFKQVGFSYSPLIRLMNSTQPSFPQATEGKCNKPKPGMMDFVGKAKWDAWNGLGAMSQVTTPS